MGTAVLDKSLVNQVDNLNRHREVTGTKSQVQETVWLLKRIKPSETAEMGRRVGRKYEVAQKRCLGSDYGRPCVFSLKM